MRILMRGRIALTVEVHSQQHYDICYSKLHHVDGRPYRLLKDRRSCNSRPWLTVSQARYVLHGGWLWVWTKFR